MRLAERHALVTGGGSGIGAAIARALAAEGALLTLVGRRLDRLEQAADAIRAAQPSARVAVAQADVTDRDDVERGFAEARAEHGPIEILINNAGAAQSAPFADLGPEVWRGIVAVNLDALFHCCQAALADLRGADQGRIVTIASTAGLRGYAYSAPYVAAKHGAVGLMRALAIEFAGTQITANAVCPGFTATEMVEEAVTNIAARTGRSAEAARAELTRFNPQGRLIAPEEVAAAVLWLCGDAARSVTGQAIAVAGGEV